MMIALDRLQFSLNPAKNEEKKFKKSCVSLSILTVPFILSGLLYFLALYDSGNDKGILVYCTARNSTGPKTTVLLWASIFVFSSCTLILYVLCFW